MTAIRISEIIHRQMGWCPQECTLSRQLPLAGNDIVGGNPRQGSGMPAHTRWLQQYRNQVLLIAVSFTLVSIPLVAFFQTDDLTRLMLSFGTIAGLGVFVFFGQWLWNSLQMLEKGITIKIGPGEYIHLFLIAGAIPWSVVLIILAFTALLSFAGVWAFPAFATGFAFIPWYVFILIRLWERKTGCILMFDKKNYLFTAARCSSYALH